MNKQKLRQLIINLGVSYNNIGELNSYTLDNIAQDMALDLSVTLLELAKELGENNYGEQVSRYVKQAEKELINQNYTMKQDKQQDKIISLLDKDTILFDNKYELKLNREQNCIDLYKYNTQDKIISLLDKDTILFDNKYELKLNCEQNCIDLYKYNTQENMNDDYDFDNDYIETLYL